MGCLLPSKTIQFQIQVLESSTLLRGQFGKGSITHQEKNYKNLLLPSNLSHRHNLTIHK